MGKRQRLITIAATLALALSPEEAALAATEQGDAGELPATAQDLTPEAVTSISGGFATRSDVDVYELCLTGGGSFSASTVGGSALDTQLFLFDEHGRGVYGNDDSGGLRQSRLPARHVLTPTERGSYFLAVSQYDRDPQSSLGPIFPSTATGVVGPSERGAGQPVASWAGTWGSAPGPYTVTVEGAESCQIPDLTPPVVDLRTPTDGAEYLLGEGVLADYSCSDSGSLVTLCAGDVPDGAAIDTSIPGPASFTVSAQDAAGNGAVASVAYRVAYDFSGFLAPVANPPAVNRWLAGRPVPVRFSLNGDHGLDAVAGVEVAQVDCGAGERPAVGEPARLVKGYGVRYRPRRDRYSSLWRSERSWAGECRQLLVRLDDGSVRRADFAFVARGSELHGEGD